MAPIKRFGFWGYIDVTGKDVIDTQFGEAKPFSEGLAPVSLTPMVYSSRGFHPPDGEWGFIDKTGKMVIKASYSDANSFENGYAEVRIGSFNVINTHAMYGYYGLIDHSGSYHIGLKFGSITSFYNGIMLVKEEGIWGIMNSKGEYIFKPQENYLNVIEFRTCWGIERY